MVDRPAIFLVVTIFVLVTVLLVFAMKYFSAARQARLTLTSEDRYRDLAEKAVKAHEESAATLASLKQTVSEIGGRLGNVERVLKDVE
jgi:signal transduction histidine kinase